MESLVASLDREGVTRRAIVQRGNLGDALLLLGAYPEAEQTLREALEHARKLGLAPAVAAIRGNLSHALARQGRLDEARAAARETSQAARALDARREGIARMFLAEIQLASGALEEAGRHTEAREAIAEARARLLERAGKIGDHALRASFLENVYEHARTIELARAWVDADLART